MWQSPGCAQPGGTGLREPGRIRAPRWILFWDNTRQGIQGWDVLQRGQRAEVAEVKVTSWWSGWIWAGLGAAPAAPCSSQRRAQPVPCSQCPELGTEEQGKNSLAQAVWAQRERFCGSGEEETPGLNPTAASRALGAAWERCVGNRSSWGRCHQGLVAAVDLLCWRGMDPSWRPQILEFSP